RWQSSIALAMGSGSRATRNAVVALAVCAPLVLAAQRLAGATAVLYPLSLAAAVLTVLLILE
ncbi:hypothetical protein, partial [Proteus mirabilis]|uniref:hypothetical protein n=1 Tax=Proteus mirabilis TaxID=584 RepID=UPI00195481C8